MDSRCIAVLLALGAAVQATGDGYQYGGYHPTPVDGGWSVYGDYSDCSVSCGHGMKTRTRVCNSPSPAHGGADCHGSRTESKKCFSGHCPVDGGWSEYSDYTECDVTCGYGQKTKTRKCNNPAPAYGGADCEGSSTESKKCFAGHCPVNGGWSEYSDYTECDVTCGDGMKTRTRKCNSPAPAYGGLHCEGDDTETAKCSSGVYCPIHGGWTAWGDYSDCSVKCGNGVKTRTRTCTDPSPAHGGDDCGGDDEETKDCYSGYRCPVHGGYSSWGTWSSCSKTCGGGIQTRERSCDNPAPRYNGNPCSGEAEESRECNKHACPRPHYPY